MNAAVVFWGREVTGKCRVAGFRATCADAPFVIGAECSSVLRGGGQILRGLFFLVVGLGGDLVSLGGVCVPKVQGGC